MKNFLATAAVLSVTSTAAFANTEYPLEIVRNGVTYNCASQTVIQNGVRAYRCANSSGGLFNGGIGSFGATAGILAVVAGLAIIAADDNDSTNGTN